MNDNNSTFVERCMVQSYDGDLIIHSDDCNTACQWSLESGLMSVNQLCEFYRPTAIPEMQILNSLQILENSRKLNNKSAFDTHDSMIFCSSSIRFICELDNCNKEGNGRSVMELVTKYYFLWIYMPECVIRLDDSLSPSPEVHEEQSDSLPLLDSIQITEDETTVASTITTENIDDKSTKSTLSKSTQLYTSSLLETTQYNTTNVTESSLNRSISFLPAYLIILFNFFISMLYCSISN